MVLPRGGGVEDHERRLAEIESQSGGGADRVEIERPRPARDQNHIRGLSCGSGFGLGKRRGIDHDQVGAGSRGFLKSPRQRRGLRPDSTKP